MRALDAIVKFFGARKDADIRSQEASQWLIRDRLQIERAIKDVASVQKAMVEHRGRQNGR